MKLQNRANSPRFTRFLAPFLMLAAIVGCQGGVDTDRGRTPTGKPDEQNPEVGAASVSVDQGRIPADGTTLTTARATLTDARGIARVGAGVVFSATLGDVTWVTTDPEDSSNLYPTTCESFTDDNGVAECTFRSGFVPGKAYISVAGPAALGLTASQQVEFVFAETASGLIVDFLSGCDGVDFPSAELPGSRQVAVQVTQAGLDGNPHPVQDIRIYYTTTLGKWKKTNDDHTSDVTDGTGVSDQLLRFDEDDEGQFVNIVASATGGTPQLCTFNVGDFSEETTFTLTAQPAVIQPDGTAQVVALGVLLSTPLAPKQNHTITFATPVGTIKPNPLFLPAGGTGAGEAALSLSATTTAGLIAGSSFDVVAVDNLSRTQQTVNIAVERETVSVTVDSVTVTFPDGTVPPASTTVAIKVHVETPEGAVAGRQVSVDFGDTKPNGVGFTDATGTATLNHLYTGLVDGDTFNVTASDVLSHTTGTGTVTISIPAGP